MCGLTGFLDLKRARPRAEMLRIVRAMADAMLHRGPDGGGAWADEASGVALGHRRLAIVDLTPAGDQPMVSASGRTVIAYNGEIYNADEIRPALEARGVRFRGHSDTEVIVEACEAWGVPEAMRRINGMFAIAVWDRFERRLHLVRDRLGIKPLYWGRMGDTILFGSQPKALRPHPAWRSEIDRDSLAGFLRFAYLPGRRSIHRGLAQVEPGRILSFGPDGTPTSRTYWDAATVAAACAERRFRGGEAEAVEALDTLLRDAVKRRMVADVPLGAFLSGGVDSSLIVGIMQQLSSRPVKTFSIGFAEQDFDEAPHAARVARHLGTDHEALYVSPEQALALVPRLPEWFDEPFADLSQVATLLVADLARSQVTVALSGDGGDELFAGYPRYGFASVLGGRLGVLPAGLRRGLAGALRGISPEGWDRLAAVLPGGLRPKRTGDRAHKIAAVLDLAEPELVYRQILSQWDRPGDLVPGATEPVEAVWTGGGGIRALDDLVERLQLLDVTTYLTDDILAKVDRATMAVSLEARAPMLDDHRVVEFAWRLPPELKHAGGEGKRILKRVLDRYVPRALVERPKQGFEIPISHWLRGGLRDWAEDLLSASALADAGIEAAPVRRRWAEHLSGTRNWQYSLWTVLMFQEWRRHWAGDAGRVSGHTPGASPAGTRAVAASGAARAIG
ncbi:asparagine synthase (glutamine-hydrolyzing) [Arenibaculum pallidiluteum]|uniref:asparagine synthase (glutamine-hydrolyzing) n=1 Tax=Arenibaculum pallidiluteum TaxID=2812559 RepID=UPI001A95FE8B|nr:asparagine synthase (glutamine-hydrolyzing) [Arenibaculum pallidiluteum]